MAVGFFIIVAAVARSIGAPYTGWANGHIEVSLSITLALSFTTLATRLTMQRIKSILNSARAEHQTTVSSRIESVQQLKEVVPLTEQLYAVAKETNKLEHENFVLSQEQAVKAELKSVLDSWVRFEQQQREAEQAALIKSVRQGVESRLADPAFKKQLLEEALSQVERESPLQSCPRAGGVICKLGFEAGMSGGAELIKQRSPSPRLSNRSTQNRWSGGGGEGSVWRGARCLDR